MQSRTEEPAKLVEQSRSGFATPTGTFEVRTDPSTAFRTGSQNVNDGVTNPVTLRTPSTPAANTAKPAQSEPPQPFDPQQAAQAAAADLPDWHPFGRLRKFLGRKPSEGLAIWRSLADVSLPGPDLANYPNSSYTLPQGGFYLENSPAGFYGGSAVSHSQWNWEYLLRYGVTDNIEFRVFSNGMTVQSGGAGFSPIAFDTKIHLWAKEWDWFNVSIGAETYIQTTSWLASSAYNGPLQYSFNLLFDHELPGDIALSWNLGFVRQSLSAGSAYLLAFQWALQRNITDNIALFVHGYHNADALPRASGIKSVIASQLQQEAIGLGGQWSASKRLAFYGSYNWGLTKYTPSYNANIGFAISF